MILSRSLPVVTQIRGHITGPPPPSPLRYARSLFIARITQHFLPSSTRSRRIMCVCVFFFFLTLLLFQLLDKPWSQVSPLSPPRFLPSIFIAHKVQQSHCSSIFHRVLLTHALALSASQFVHKKKSQRIYTRRHSAGLELTKLTYTRLEDNLIRYRVYRVRTDACGETGTDGLDACRDEVHLLNTILHTPSGTPSYRCRSIYHSICHKERKNRNKTE